MQANFKIGTQDRSGIGAMHGVPLLIRTQQPADLSALSKFHEDAFGPGRFSRTAYRVREGCITEPDLNLCITDGPQMIGAIQFTPVTIGGEGDALLLGPLVIAEARKNQGWGLKLMLEGMSRGAHLGYRFVILVGDPPYYARAGFSRMPDGQIEMPGPVDPARLLYVELAAGVLARYRGMVRGIPESAGVSPAVSEGREAIEPFQGKRNTVLHADLR